MDSIDALVEELRRLQNWIANSDLQVHGLMVQLLVAAPRLAALHAGLAVAVARAGSLLNALGTADLCTQLKKLRSAPSVPAVPVATTATLPAPSLPDPALVEQLRQKTAALAQQQAFCVSLQQQLGQAQAQVSRPWVEGQSRPSFNRLDFNRPVFTSWSRPRRLMMHAGYTAWLGAGPGA